MKYILFSLLLIATSLFAQSPQEQVAAQFTAVLKESMRIMIQKRFPADLHRRSLSGEKLDIDAEIERMLPRAFAAFGPELQTTEADAEALSATGPNDLKNREAIEKNEKIFMTSPLPMPAIVSTMMEQMRKEGQDFNGWRLETLRRLTEGTIRQLRERGELK